MTRSQRRRFRPCSYEAVRSDLNERSFFFFFFFLWEKFYKGPWSKASQPTVYLYFYASKVRVSQNFFFQKKSKILRTTSRNERDLIIEIT